MISACVLATIGLAGAGWAGASYWAIFFLSIATIGIYGSRPPFWPMASTFLTGTAAAGAIALINSIGNLGGYVGPMIVGWTKDVTKSFDAGLYSLAASILLGALITFFAAPKEGGGAPARVVPSQRASRRDTMVASSTPKVIQIPVRRLISNARFGR